MLFITYFFFFFICLLTFLVIFSSNIIHSVLFLILVYLLVASFFIWVGVEFLSIMLFIIYVGAISVLFLFVVMLLNLRSLELYNHFYNYLPVGSSIGIFFFFEIIYIFFINFNFDSSSLFFDDTFFVFWLNICFFKSNIYIFGLLLYNYYWFFVCILGILLLIAMIGSIILIIENSQNVFKFYLPIVKNEKMAYLKRKIFHFFKSVFYNFLNTNLKNYKKYRLTFKININKFKNN